MPQSNSSQPINAERKCPISVIIIAALFAAAGGIGLVYHASEFKINGSLQGALLLVCFVRLLALVAAVFMLRGHNWARWLAIVWLAYHIILSAFHNVQQVIVHSLLLGVIAYLLFRPQVSAYFRRAKTAQN